MIRINNLSFRYSSKKGLDGISCNIHEGSITGILGPNGAGKSTLLKLISGSIVPPAGTIYYKERDLRINELRFKEEMSSIIEHPSIYGHMTVAENLNYFGLLYGKSQHDVEVLMTPFMLDGHRDIQAKRLSYGLKQRLGLALSLVNNPKVLILDEPTNGLDPDGIKFFRNLITELNRDKNITFVISGHILAELEKICTHVLVISEGGLKYETDDADEIKSLESLYFKIIEND